MRHCPCSQSNASLLSGPGPSLPGLRDPPPDKYVPPQTEKRRGASISESFFTSLSSSYAQCMHGEDWVLNLLGSPLASSPVSKSFPNRSVGKKPSHRPLTVNTIILHIQMRITPGQICSSHWSVLTHLTPDWFILYHFQTTQPPISITTSLFTSSYRLKVFLISNVSILIYVGGIF